MSTVTISSGVHLGTRDDSEDFIDWFDASPTSQFSTFSFSATATVKSSAQRISGHAGLRGAPIEFGVERRARDVVSAHLVNVAAEGLLNGRPRTTLSGFRDAVMRSGFLCKVAWSERNNAGGANQAFEVWGVIVVNDATVQGLNERLSFTVWPCCAVAYTGLGSWVLNPECFAELGGGEDDPIL